ncbi:MAG: DUF3419 family protein [Puniceicoccaceae bacterium]
MDRLATEAAEKADFSGIRYAQVWEDADILLEALAVRDDSVCLSIASAGDNVLSLLAGNPRKVYAVDLSPAQLHCLALRVAAFRCLSYGEVLGFDGARPSSSRAGFYRRCRDWLEEDARLFWDERPSEIAAGFASAGRFERYFSLFRRRILPLVHGRRRIEALLAPKGPGARRRFYRDEWNTWRWRLLFRVFFSRFMMGKLGRDPAFFQYVEGNVAERVRKRTEYALTELQPADNPYLQWILLGRSAGALPLYLREENFGKIRRNLDRLEWRLSSVEDFTAGIHEPCIDACNLSDIFEYLSEKNTSALLEELHRVCRPRARLAYWNMLAPRSRPPEMESRLRPLDELAGRLFLRDKAFFYSRFVIEEVCK